jgi:hypothetical protein
MELLDCDTRELLGDRPNTQLEMLTQPSSSARSRPSCGHGRTAGVGDLPGASVGNRLRV